MEPRDPTLDVLLDLDRQVLMVDPEGGHWVRFVVTRVPVSPSPPAADDQGLRLPDAVTLLGDCWTTVDAVLRERGVIP